ncbi:MAG: hypothetical protein HC781_09640 [Leptolyngbyaceae cyanobacterium CSU_1_4]|nr:hypothetical protein [Leptolyngbyaceae cyanobacterium CSU_1_4]
MLGGGDSVSQQSPTALPEPSPGVAERSPNAQPFSQSTGRAQPQQNRPRGIMPPDLISSTNPDQRLKGIQSARSDPFALVPVAPAITITRDSSPSSGSRQSSGSPGSSASGGGSSGSGSLRIPAGTQALLPQPIPILPDIPRLPRSLPAALPPQPELARAVNVSGVVQIGSAVYAIVDAPDEPSSRYVQVGQRLSNGEILVRRIDFNGSDSSVILEQAGMQVVRRVGDVPVAPAAPAAPAAPSPPAAQPAAAA